MSAARILVAGIGNVFLGDDGFGVEVVSRLAARRRPEGVEIADFGIRGFDLAYALMGEYDLVILVDAIPLGKKPGSVTVIEPDVERLELRSGSIDSHAMNPLEVFRHVKQMGGRMPRTLLVGCEPAAVSEDEDSWMRLSPEVEAAIPEALRMVEALVARATEKQEVSRA